MAPDHASAEYSEKRDQLRTRLSMSTIARMATRSFARSVETMPVSGRALATTEAVTLAMYSGFGMFSCVTVRPGLRWR